MWRGDTLFGLLDYFPGLHMAGVDSFDPPIYAGPKDREAGLAHYDPDELDRAREFVVQKMRSIVGKKYAGRCVLILADTLSAARLVPDGSVDFVFVDADHRAEAVAADVRAWLPKVRAGGALLGHDEDWPSVRRGLTQTVGTWVALPGNVWRART